MDRVATLTTVEELLAEAAAEIDRLTPAEAHEATAAGDLLIDIRPVEQRERDGLVPGAAVVDRNAIEGVQGWMAAGLPLEPATARSTKPR